MRSSEGGQAVKTDMLLEVSVLTSKFLPPASSVAAVGAVSACQDVTDFDNRPSQPSSPPAVQTGTSLLQELCAVWQLMAACGSLEGNT